MVEFNHLWWEAQLLGSGQGCQAWQSSCARKGLEKLLSFKAEPYENNWSHLFLFHLAWGVLVLASNPVTQKTAAFRPDLLLFLWLISVFFSFRFYIESISYLKDNATIELFFLNAKSCIYKVGTLSSHWVFHWKLKVSFEARNPKLLPQCDFID